MISTHSDDSANNSFAAIGLTRTATLTLVDDIDFQTDWKSTDAHWPGLNASIPLVSQQYFQLLPKSIDPFTQPFNRAAGDTENNLSRNAHEKIVAHCPRSLLLCGCFAECYWHDCISSHYKQQRLHGKTLVLRIRLYYTFGNVWTLLRYWCTWKI